jgi:predicted Zn-dependent protease
MMRAHPAIALTVGLLFLFGLSGCETVGSATAPRFSKQQEENMAREAAVEFEQKNKLWKDPLLEAYVRQIVQRLDQGIPPEKKYPWSVRIVNSPAVNAFTFGGGLIYVYAGLVARMENEAQFATVLGHEMAHSTEHHISRGIKAQYGVQTAGKLLGSVLGGLAGGGVPFDLVNAAAAVSGLGLQAASSGLSRGHEREADEYGMEYLVGAHYDPREAPRTFEKLHELYGDPPLADTFFYSSHPSNVQRFEYLTHEYETKYMAQIAEGNLIVNTEEHKRRTRPIVIEVGKLDYGEKRFMTSEKMMEKALRAYDKDPVPHYWIAKVAMDAEGKPDKAVEHLEKAIELDRNYSEAYRELGTAYYMAGFRSKAIAAYQRYLKLEPKARDRSEIEASIEELGRY